MIGLLTLLMIILVVILGALITAGVVFVGLLPEIIGILIIVWIIRRIAR